MNRRIRMTTREKISEIFDLSKYPEFCREIGKAVIGLEAPRDFVCTGLLAGGHVLIDGPPGLGKTLLAQAIAMGTNLKFTKVQLSGDQTSDALKGYEIVVPHFTVQGTNKEDFVPKIKTLIREGPLVGSQYFFFDEVTRANTEAHNSLFSAMQEGYFYIGDVKFDMDPLFTTVATRNAFESSGIRPLSFAFLDRFSLSVLISRPSKEEEDRIAILPKKGNLEKIIKVWDKEEILRLRTFIESEVLFPEGNNIVKYLRRLIRTTDIVLDENKDFFQERENRKARKLDIGGSPRATASLVRMAVVYVYCILREKTIYPEHIQILLKQTLRHKLVFKGITEGESIIRAEELVDEIIERTPILRR